MEAPQKDSQSITIAITAAIVVATVISFTLIKRFSKAKASKNTPEAQREKIVNQAVSQIKVEYEWGGYTLTLETVVEIAKALRDLNADESYNLTVANHKLRQTQKDNFEHYAKTCEQLIFDLHDSSKSVQRSVLAHLKIPPTNWENSYYGRGRQNEPRLKAVKTEVSEAQAERMKTLTFDELKAALTRYTELLEKEKVNVPNVQPMLNNPRNAGRVLSIKVSDIVCEELGVKGEDFTLSMKGYTSKLEKEEPELLQRYVQVTKELEVDM